MPINYILPEQRSKILELLDSVEQHNEITIVHAVESGSRAWGFPSKDSDYDIRFIYHHSIDWYITAFDKKAHIELPIVDDLDPGGWDIGKCLLLLYKGNVALHEWVNSPVIYRTSEKMSELKLLAHEVFYPPAAYYHYLSLAKKKLSDSSTASNAKSFLYCLRALLCAKWVKEKSSAPPVLFDVLVDEYFDKPLRDALDQVLEAKLKTCEAGSTEIPQILMYFSLELLNVLSSIGVSGEKQASKQQFDKVLRYFVS